MNCPQLSPLRDSSRDLRIALKNTKIQLSIELSSSPQVPLDRPSKVIGCELFVQKVMHESIHSTDNPEGSATLYESMLSYVVEPVEAHSIASTTADQTSLKLTFFES